MTPKAKEASTPPAVTAKELMDKMVERISFGVLLLSNTCSELLPIVKRKKNVKYRKAKLMLSLKFLIIQ
ncbi:hypothetical protein VCHA34P129_430005 [Vibrio chagasii]|nr:hypothetical protein VCHA34P129_430005 [Vibrio chagasii]CAH7281587.1 hypothetical protein VCHA52P455_440005 [Vibrio chagasii]